MPTHNETLRILYVFFLRPGIGERPKHASAREKLPMPREYTKADASRASPRKRLLFRLSIIPEKIKELPALVNRRNWIYYGGF